MPNSKLNRNPTRTAFITSAVLLLTVAEYPAGQQSEPAFEVASIKENKTGATGVSMNVLPGSRLVATNISLETLIAGAYGTDIPLPPSRVVMPAGWAGSGAPRFDIEAKPGRALTQTEFLPAVRRLLEDRFKLAVHYETREQPSYALVMDRADDRLGARLKRSEVDCTDPVEIKARAADGTLWNRYAPRGTQRTGTTHGGERALQRRRVVLVSPPMPHSLLQP